MKKQLLCLVLILSVFKSLGQAPPNLLDRSEEEVKYKAESLKARLTDHETTLKGKLMLHFNFDYNGHTGLNNMGNTLYYMLFRFDLPDSCTLCLYGFSSNRDLNRIVAVLDRNKKLRRKGTTLGWHSINNKFDIDISSPINNSGFTVIYTKLEGAKAAATSSPLQ